MADDDTRQQQPTGQEPATDPGDGPQQPPADLGDAGKKALEEERKAKRAAEKRAADLEVRIKAFEDRDKTDQQKLTERAEVAERKVPALEAETTRLRFALRKAAEIDSVDRMRAFLGLVDRLRGDTEAELAADADVLLGLLAPGGAPPQQPRRPVETLRPGATDERPRPRFASAQERLAHAYAQKT